MFPDRQISFTSYNILTIAALVANSDMLAIIPSRFYNLFSRCWPLEKLPFPSLNEEQIDFSIHYNKFSLRDRSIDQHLAPGWLYALSQCGLFVVLFVVFIVGMGMSAFRA